MSKTLSYFDAVRLLGGDQRLLARIDSIVGGVILGAAPAMPAALALLDAKTELIKIGSGLITRLRERRSGLSRFDRTQRLSAAHVVLVVTAYFEVLAESELPVRFAELGLTRQEQFGLAGTDPFAGGTRN